MHHSFIHSFIPMEIWITLTSALQFFKACYFLFTSECDVCIMSQDTKNCGGNGREKLSTLTQLSLSTHFTFRGVKFPYAKRFSHWGSRYQAVNDLTCEVFRLQAWQQRLWCQNSKFMAGGLRVTENLRAGSKMFCFLNWHYWFFLPLVPDIRRLYGLKPNAIVVQTESSVPLALKLVTEKGSEPAPST